MSGLCLIGAGLDLALSSPVMSVPISALPSLLQHLGTLARVLPWGLSQSPQWLVSDVVIQDEYTHDVLLSARGIPHTLVLDCT